jgi:glycosyltransferase involved in cell wall biosynthesis
MTPLRAEFASDPDPSTDDAPPLRIAMVVASPFPANHGTPGSIREMAEAIADEGHQVHFVTYHFGEAEDPGGMHVHRVAAPHAWRGRVVVGPTWQKPLLDLLLVLTLIRVIRKERIDVIHAHNYEGALIGWLARLFTRRPLVYNAINTMIDELPSYGFIRPKALAVAVARTLDWVVPRLASHVIAISDDLARFLHDRGVDPNSVEVITLGIETSRFQVAAGREELRRRFVPDGGPLVIYTGILARLQRLDYLLQAMRRVVDKRPEARLLIVANCVVDAERQELMRQVAALDLGAHVAIHEVASFDEIPPLLAAADLAVVPRPSCPGFPVKLLNYMAAGKPIVVFEGSAKGLAHRRSAWVVRDHDWEALGQGMLALIEDPDLAARLGANARRQGTEEFAWPALTERTVAVYRRLLAAEARPTEAAR